MPMSDSLKFRTSMTTASGSCSASWYASGERCRAPPGASPGLDEEDDEEEDEEDDDDDEEDEEEEDLRRG